MLADKDFLESLFFHIGKKLRHEVEALLIGGNAMLYYDLRGQTKDLDIVFYKKQDIAGIIQIIKNHPLYKKAKQTKELPYAIKAELLKKGTPVLIGNKDMPRFDLFYRYVFSVDTEKIFDSAKRSMRFELLKLKLPEPEELIFLKAATDRPQDKEDIIRIVKNLDLDWEKLENIMKNYYKENSKAVFFALGSLVDINKKDKIIPEEFLKKIAKMFELVV